MSIFLKIIVCYTMCLIISFLYCSIVLTDISLLDYFNYSYRPSLINIMNILDIFEDTNYIHYRDIYTLRDYFSSQSISLIDVTTKIILNDILMVVNIFEIKRSFYEIYAKCIQEFQINLNYSYPINQYSIEKYFISLNKSLAQLKKN